MVTVNSNPITNTFTTTTDQNSNEVNKMHRNSRNNEAPVRQNIPMQPNSGVTSSNPYKDAVMQHHMMLLLHSVNCTKPECPSINCKKMKVSIGIFVMVIHTKSNMMTIISSLVNPLNTLIMHYYLMMQEFLRHPSICTNRYQPGGCQTCSRVENMLKYHAQQCPNSNCNVPHCQDIRRAREEQRRLADDIDKLDLSADEF